MSGSLAGSTARGPYTQVAFAGAEYRHIFEDNESAHIRRDGHPVNGEAVESDSGVESGDKWRTWRKRFDPRRLEDSPMGLADQLKISETTRAGSTPVSRTSSPWKRAEKRS